MRQQYHSRWVGGDRWIWDVRALVRKAASLQPSWVPLSGIREFDEDWWFPGQTKAVTPRQVAEHARLLQEVDLAYPIILSSDGRLMDGMHRVAKAHVLGKESILAIRFVEDPPPDYVNVDLGSLPYDDEDDDDR